VTGSSVTRARGGGSGPNGGSVANSGNGGHSQNSPRTGVAGDSGAVFIKYDNTFADLIIGSGLQYKDSGGVTQSGTGSRVAASFTPTGFKVYEIVGGTGNVEF
jgi:hypothetical protein